MTYPILRRFIMGILFLLFCNTVVYSQIIKSVGLANGVSLSTTHIYGWQIIELEYKLGVYSAANIDFFNNKYVSCRASFEYCQKGNKFLKLPIYNYDTGTYEGSTENVKTEFDYLFFNTSLKLSYPFKKFIPYLIVGGGYGQMIKTSDLKFKEYYGFDVSTDFNVESWVVNNGIGLSYEFQKVALFCEYQNQYDINWLFEGNNVGLKNNSSFIALGVNYLINIKSE